MGLSNNKKWTENDRQFLADNYAKKGAVFCSLKLKRTLYGVRRKARILGISSLNNSANYSEENIRKAVLKSKTVSDTIRNLGLRCAGGNFSVIKKYISIYKIDTSHFKSQKEIVADLNKIRKRSLSEILIKDNYTLNSHNVKKRLYVEGIKQPICEKCGQDENWRGEIMALILDHKNGIHSDWRVENLRILCPNCNATLPTHCGKNNRKNKCQKCSVNINHNGKYCRNCFYETLKGKPSFSTRKVKNRPTEIQIIKDVNELGYRGTGKKYGVSDNAVRKWLKKT